MTTTPTLGLTQFEATDTINFLTQYNTDLSKIDTNAKMTKAIGSDYIYSYTTAPSYTGGTVTIYAGTNFITANGKDANGNIKQDIVALSINKTLSLTGNINCNIFLGFDSSIFSIENSNQGIVDFVSQLPTTVATTNPYMYYVINEHKYYRTSGSTTANWQIWNCCKVASVRVTSSTITYFKPNLQLNLAQKIGKDKLLMTMAEVNANTDKEFVPSAVAMKELGVDYITSKGTSGNWNWVKWASGKVELDGMFTSAFGIGTAWGTGGLYFHKTSAPITFPFTVNGGRACICQNGDILNYHCGTLITTSGLDFYIINSYSTTLTTAQSGQFRINVVGTY